MPFCPGVVLNLNKANGPMMHPCWRDDGDGGGGSDVGSGISWVDPL